MEIASRGNPLVKLVRSLREKKFREREQLFIMEGVRLTEEALKVSTPLRTVFHTARLTSQPRGLLLLEKIQLTDAEVYEVSESMMEYLSPAETPQGVLATAPLLSYPIEEFKLDYGGFYLLAEDINDPGNLGTMFRTCRAAGVQSVFLTGSTCDPFNPKVVRSSMGAVLTLPFHTPGDPQLFFESLYRQGVMFIATTPTGGKPYDVIHYRAPVILMMGQEARGLSLQMLSLAAERVFIPMEGGVESLNVAVSAGILLFHARRMLYPGRV